MSDGLIVALIGFIGTLLGAAVGAFATIRAAQLKASSENQGNPPYRPLPFAVIGLISSLAAVVGLVLGVLFATQIIQLLANNSQVTFAVNLPANANWYNTRIQINAGQTIEVVASGNVATFTGEDLTESGVSGPDGQATICPDAANPEVAKIGCLMNSEPYGALVARIGDGAPFKVGSIYSGKASASGILFLAVNDNYPYYEDNQGAYSISITIK